MCRRYAPVKDGVAERANVALAAEELVPNLICEGLRLRVGREADLARRATQGECDDLACGLTLLDILGHERAVGQVRARVGVVVPFVANLSRTAVSFADVVVQTRVAQTLAKSMTGSPPSPRKMYKKAIGNTSMVVSLQ